MSTRKWIRDDEDDVIAARPVIASPKSGFTPSLYQIGQPCPHCGRILVEPETARISPEGRVLCKESLREGRLRWVERQRRRGTLRREL